MSGLPQVEFAPRPTRPVRVGNSDSAVTIGGGYPIVIQSMITEETHNVPSAVEQIIAMHKAGSEIVRVTTPNLNEAKCLADIKALLRQKYMDVPLVADVHHQGSDIAVEVARYVDKIRINPGLFVFRKRVERTIDYSQAEIEEEQAAIERELLPVLEACKRRDLAMRIGVNHGSLAERLTVMYGDTPEGMVQSALEYIEICERNDFRNIVVSLKASRVQIMLQANRLMAQRMAERGMNYPLHLGVTEAGDGQYARIKSTTGIGTLLAEGIGDTIRVSLSEDPINEIPVCREILQALGLRRFQTEFIACPSCGRTKFDLPTVLAQVKAATGHLAGLNIAVMGCIVNGPGEMADADYGYVGKAGGKISLYRKRYEVKSGIAQENGVAELIALLKSDGVWQDPPDGWEIPAAPVSFNERIKTAIPLAVG
jgi:(E)-4-hydroxy-3-methylbut-2-enyl-diphosphate synthase